jgi:hypothetical protein
LRLAFRHLSRVGSFRAGRHGDFDAQVSHTLARRCCCRRTVLAAVKHALAFAVVTWTPGAVVAWVNQPATSLTATYTGLNGGTNFPAGSMPCVAIATRSGASSGQPFTSITIGGVTATQIETDGSGSLSLYLYCASVAGSTTDSITINGTGFINGYVGVAAGYFTGSATTATAVGCSGFGNQNSESTETIQVTCTGANTTITNPTGGFGLAAIYGRSGVAATSCGVPTWSTTGSSNITASGGDVNTCSITNPDWLSLAHTATAGSWGPSASSTPAWVSNASMVAVTFGPAGAAAACGARAMKGVGC